MVNLFLILAFLCDVTQYKEYVVPIFDIECIYVVYFAALFRAKTIPSTLLAFVLAGIGLFINGASVGAGLIFFFTGILCHFVLVVYPRQKALGTMYSRAISTKPQSIVTFFVIYIVSVFIQTVVTVLLGYDIKILYTLLSFFVNFLFFSIIILCT